MALILPKGFKGLAWDACAQFLCEYSEPNKAFTGTLKPESGFIVAYWADEASQIPTHYLRRVGYSSPTYITLDSFLKFGDGVEDPLRPRTFSATGNLVKVAGRKLKGRFGLIFWVSPKVEEFVPDDYVLAMEGQRRPTGSVEN